jgi:hypothetical protein
MTQRCVGVRPTEYHRWLNESLQGRLGVYPLPHSSIQHMPRQQQPFVDSMVRTLQT